MFDIRIGSYVPAVHAHTMIPQLNPLGYESYALNFNRVAPEILPHIGEHARAIVDALDGRTISAIGYYGNPLTDLEFRENLIRMIKSAHLYGCSLIGTFAGGLPGQPVPDAIPLYKEVFTELSKIADAEGVRLSLEAHGCNWNASSGNIGFCPAAWELMFDALDVPSVGLEWEPAHMLRQVMDPIPVLRKWAKKINHLHGKDGTVAWDVLRDYGIDGGREWMWHRLPGFGDSNWADIFSILIKSGFEGNCDIESYHDPVHFDDMEYSAQKVSLDYLKRCRGGIDFIPGPPEYHGFPGSVRKPGRGL